LEIFRGKRQSATKKVMKSVLTKGELGIEDLPPIEDLNVSVEENKCKEIGTINSIVDTQGEINFHVSHILFRLLTWINNIYLRILHSGRSIIS
jgi:UDP-N-acetylglucosamine enolpyruvyl transferase